MDKQNRSKIKWVRSTINSLLLLGLLTVVMSSCYYRENEVIRPEPPPIPPDEDLSYSEFIQPIWDLRCATSNCHDGRWNPNLVDGVSYNSLIGGGYVNNDDPQDSEIYTIVATGGSMAKYAATGDAELILRWIEEGAQNN